MQETLDRFSALSLIDQLKTSEGNRRHLKFLVSGINEPPADFKGDWIDHVKGAIRRTFYENRENQQTITKILDPLGIR